METVSKIVLRPPLLADAEISWRWRNQSSVRDFFSGHMYTVTFEDEHRWLQEQIAGKNSNVTFSVLRADTMELVGMTFLKNIHSNYRQAEFAILIDEQHAGQGFGTAACMATLAHGFGTLLLHRIYLKVRVDNVPALRSYEKCGFKLEGTLRDDVFKNGVFIDQHIMSILDNEFSGIE